MSWQDRLREAVYTSPNGTRQAFDYEDLSGEIELRGTAYNFPDADGTYVQRTGRSGRRMPLRMIFWGADCDIEAQRFESLLLETGVGRLSHPVYGLVDVVPFGPLTRRDDLKTAANQVIIEVVFWETIGIIYPASQADPSSAVLSSIEAYNSSSSEQFGESVDISTAGARVALKNVYSVLVGAAGSGLDSVASATDKVSRQFNSIYSSITQGIDSLIGEPVTLARQTALLIQSPGRAASSIAARLSAYRSLAAGIITSSPTGTGPGIRPSNEFHSRDLFASGYVSASVVSVVNNRFETKTAALLAAEEVLSQLDAVVAWRDTRYTDLQEVDTGELYQNLAQSVALAAGFLVEISFSLKQERIIVLDRARTIIDLAAEIYGSVDDQLDFLINTNALTGSEILELPRGRQIVYYV